MTSRVELCCLGMRCPRPIIELAKAARRSAGAKIHIEADDPAFESDVRAWCETTGAELVELSSDGVRVMAIIQIKG